MLLHAIPPYRLPKEIVGKQIDALKKTGIEIRVGIAAGKKESVAGMVRRFDAVFIAAGAWKERPMGIKEEALASSGLAFLGRVNVGRREIPGKNVAVIGGGNVALDVARTLLRLGAKPVVVYRRTRAEMPALADEVEKALEEGVRFRFLTLPKQASKEGRATKLTCTRAKLGAPDASGRRSPVEIPGSEFTLKFDAVIKAIGEMPDVAFLPAAMQTKARQKGERARLLGGKVFAGGDFLTGPSTVIEALAAGKEAAGLIDASLKAKNPSTGIRPRSPSYKAVFRGGAPPVRPGGGRSGPD